MTYVSEAISVAWGLRESKNREKENKKTNWTKARACMHEKLFDEMGRVQENHLSNLYIRDRQSEYVSLTTVSIMNS
jgi:hypothetical protein